MGAHIHLTITVTDPTTAIDLIASLQSDGYDVAVTTTPHTAAPAATSYETGPRHPAVDAVLDHEIRHQMRADLRAAREAHKAERYAEMAAKYDRVLVVPCPTCAATAGRPCRKASGTEYKRPYYHAKRFGAWQIHSITPTTTPVGRPDWMPTVVMLDEV